jgi:hypothetical protein
MSIIQHKCEKMPPCAEVHTCTDLPVRVSELSISFENDRTSNYIMSSFGVRYCPFCGKDLKEDEEE